MRKKIIAGNWKMNKIPSESAKLAKEIVDLAKNVTEADVVVCPPYTSLQAVSDVVKNSNVFLGAQDMHWEKNGAFTGKISGEMLLDLGVKYVILGHSEQRTYFFENDHTVNQKVLRAIECGLIPIVCVGETLDEREANRMNDVVQRQVDGAFNSISKENAAKCIIAYEPVWAIGTGKNATSQQAQEMHHFIRGLVEKLYGSNISSAIRILYGGSMKPDNASELLSQNDVDGGLIGGAALQAESFLSIVRSGR